MIETGILARRALKQAGVMSFALTFASGVWAQAAAPAAKAAATPASSASSVAAADRAQRETDRTLYWIRVLSDKPAVKPTATAAAAPAPAPAPVPAPRPAAARPAPEPTRVAQAAPKPAATTVAAASAETSSAGNLSLGARTTPEPAPSAGTVATGVQGSGVDASPAVGGALAAPALTPPAPLDVPAIEVEEPDPGLIMVSSVDPEFPMNLMRRLRKGEVEVRFEVGPDGQVDVVSVEKSSHHGLEQAALDAVRQWRFKPTPHGHAALVDLAFNMDQ
jgi:TonB family protein